MSSIFMGRQPGAKPNNWKMSWGELVEAIGLARKVKDGSAFLEELTKARFDSIPTLDESAKINACRQLAGTFKSSSDRWMRDCAGRCESAQALTDAATAVRDLFRGYSDTEKATAMKDAASRRSALTARIDQAIQDNDAMAQAIARLPQPTTGQKKHKDAYDQNVTKLRNLKSDVQQKLDNPIVEGELSRLAANRHMPGFSHSLWLASFTNEEWIVDSCDPDRVTFPFRFLIHAPLQTYRGLLDEWKKTKNAFAVASKIAAEVFTGAYGDTLVALFNDTPFATDFNAPAIIGVLAELRDALLHRRLQSVTLLAVTQAEGAIWRYADLLNTSGYPVYTTNADGRKIAGQHAWDRQNASTAKSPNNQPMNSARELLGRTRIEQAFRPNVVDQVIAEYADDRNSLAHGSLIADERLAVQAALLLGTVYQCITQYEAEGRPTRAY